MPLRIARRLGPYSLEAAMARAGRRGLKVRTVIDVGASDGRWSRHARRHFPRAFCFLIEARSEHEPALRDMKRGLANVDYIIAAAGDTVGEIFFHATEDLFGGLACREPFDRRCIRVPATTIDAEVARRGLRGPFLIKLDTHGFEAPILAGARRTLRRTGLIVMEAYNFNLSPESLRFPQMCAYMERLGFRAIDMCELMFRPGDEALWQMDMLFVPSSSRQFDRDSYEA